jgi:hypothetical protein
VEHSSQVSTSSATAQTNLDSLIDDLEESVEYHLKTEDSSQILEVYEISNIEDAEMTYETEDNEDESERYELVNVISDPKAEIEFEQRPEKQKIKAENKPKTPMKAVDEDTMSKAIKEVFSNSSR